MRPDSLMRLIEAATPEELRQIARLILKLLGYAESRTTDGPYDGGTDLRVLAGDGAELPQAIALSVEQKWERKLREDAVKAKNKLGLTRMLFITSRRVPELSFRAVRRELEQAGVQVDRIDQQRIADMILERNAVGELLGVFGIDLSAGQQPREPADRRRDVAFAYAFFSPEVRSFRDEIRETSLMTALMQAGGAAKVHILCADAALLLGAPVDTAPHFLPVIERLRTRGQLLGINGAVSLSPEARATFTAVRALREHEEAALRARVSEYMIGSGLAATEPFLTTIFKSLGALMLRHVGVPGALEDLHAQLRRFHRELEAHGLPRGARGEALIQGLLELVRGSQLGQTLATGALYRALANLNRDALLAAFDARSLTLILDASVAIPMFCVLFGRPVRQRFFVVAKELHRCATRLGLQLQLPAVWLEEMASHLLKAPNFRALVQARLNDLRMSDNAYVAYFVNERNERGEGDFDRFLASFGLTHELERRAAGDFQGARETLEQFLRRQLARYGVTVIDTPIHGSSLAPVERAWDWARHELGVDQRDAQLERHDKTVLAWMATRTAEDPTQAPLIVTWDRVLRHVQPAGAPGGALDPLALNELLSFVGGEEPTGGTAEFAGLWIGEREAERGAQVLDTLVRLEREDMSDAAVVQRVQEFRDQYLAGHREGADVPVLEQEWRKFRAVKGSA